MLKFKKGDTVAVTDSEGTVREAMFCEVSYPKNIIHYHVKVKKPSTIGNHKYRIADWYLPESRFVMPEDVVEPEN